MESIQPNCLQQEEVISQRVFNLSALSPEAQANRWILSNVLGVDEMRVTRSPASFGVSTYSCIKDRKTVCRIDIPDDLPPEDKVTTIKVALRLTHGDHSKG